jgi:catechol 2,3-dioxygenase-like lactoylglutathione lyase family enzyme
MTVSPPDAPNVLDAAAPPPPRPRLPVPPPAAVAPGQPRPSELAARSPITHVRSMSLGVPDLARTRLFYEELWGLYPVAEDSGVVWLGTVGSPEPFVLRLRADATTRSDVMAFGAADAAGVDRLAEDLAGGGVQLLGEPGAIDQPGGGYGFRFFDPDGRTVEVSSDVAAKPYRALEERESVPRKLSHIVVNSDDVAGVMAFYVRYLGFRLSDWLEDRMCFLRCSEEHHNLAIAHHRAPNLNHVSFEMAGVEEYLRGTGRMVRAGVAPLWGPGRHSAGDNTYAYFRDPNDVVVEYTTELERIPDEDAWVPRVWPATNDYADRWGTGGTGADLFALGGQSGIDAGNWAAPPI